MNDCEKSLLVKYSDITDIEKEDFLQTLNSRPHKRRDQRIYTDALKLREEGRTFKEIGSLLSVSTARAREIYLKACKMLSYFKLHGCTMFHSKNEY